MKQKIKNKKKLKFKQNYNQNRYKIKKDSILKYKINKKIKMLLIKNKFKKKLQNLKKIMMLRQIKKSLNKNWKIKLNNPIIFKHYNKLMAISQNIKYLNKLTNRSNKFCKSKKTNLTTQINRLK